MKKIKFGTDGWRAIIAKDFTVANVARVAEATADWVLKQNKNPQVVVGHDCRFAGKLFAETVAKVCVQTGSKSFIDKRICFYSHDFYGCRSLQMRSGNYYYCQS